MEFRVLGPLEVVDDDGVPLQLGGPRPRALLAQLLLCANQAVSTDRLIDAVWGEAPPASAPGALQVHVHALRKALGADRIVTRAPGYLVRVEPGELDSERFERLAASGADGIPEALALWRGPAVADLAYEAFAQAGANRLEEARLAALESRLAADLDAGRHASVAAELEPLVAAHPHREQLRAHQMVALYRAGRQADSLAGGSEPRFSMLETIRAYALAELEEPERLDELRRGQLAWCIALAEDDQPRWWERGTPWLDRAEPELANVAAALEFARETDDVESELRLAASMRHLWRGHGLEARQRLEEACARIDRVDARLRGRVLHETAVMRMSAGDYDGARAAWLSAMETFEELEDALQIGRIHAELAALSNAAGDPEAGIEYGRTADELLADEEFLRLIVLGNLAESYEQSGDLALARSTALGVLEGQRRLGDRDGVAYMSFALASIAMAEGDLAEAHRRLIECFTVASEVGFAELTAYALGVAADLALALDEPDTAATLLEAARERFGRIGGAPQAHEVERHARVAATVDELLEDPEPAFARGRDLRPDEAVAIAFALDTGRD